MSESTMITASVRSTDGRTEIEFTRSTEWNAPVQITLGTQTIEVYPGPLVAAGSLINLEGNPT